MVKLAYGISVHSILFLLCLIHSQVLRYWAQAWELQAIELILKDLSPIQNCMITNPSIVTPRQRWLVYCPAYSADAAGTPIDRDNF